MNNNILVPKLRFKEFEGEWSLREVGQLFDVTRGNVLSMNLVSDIKTDEFPYPVYSSQTKNSGLAGFYKDFLFEDSITWTTDGANAGDVNFRLGKFYCTNVCGVLLNTKGYANSCIAEIINSVSKNHVSYVGNPKLMNGVMSRIEIPVPYSIIEQQKIASTLTSLDNLIEAHSEKLELLKKHKKGLMQNLFPQEGERVPKYRFKEFEGDGEWEEKPLNKITTSIFDGTHQTPKYTSEGVPFFSVENIVSGNDNKFISREDYLFETRNNKPEMGDVLITRIGSIGKTCVVDWDYEFSIYVTLAVIKKSDIFDPYYLSFYIQSERCQNEIIRRSLLQAAPQKINMNELRECIVMLPPDFKEQQEIASLLSSLEELINSEIERIEELTEHKKGLMQGMFPVVE